MHFLITKHKFHSCTIPRIENITKSKPVFDDIIRPLKIAIAKYIIKFKVTWIQQKVNVGDSIFGDQRKGGEKFQRLNIKCVGELIWQIRLLSILPYKPRLELENYSNSKSNFQLKIKNEFNCQIVANLPFLCNLFHLHCWNECRKWSWVSWIKSL